MNLCTNADNTSSIQIPRCLFTHIGNFIGKFFFSPLCIPDFYFEFLHMN